MADLYRDNYSKAYPFDFIDGVGRGYSFDTAANAAKNWYHARTINSKTEARAILATNRTAAGISFNAYMYGSPKATAENFLFFSENVQSGMTTGGTQKWNSYGGANTTQTPIWSQIVMPDGTTNGVKCLTDGADPNNGIYQPFVSTSVLEKGKMYTASVWACGDSGGGAYTANPTMRISYFSPTVVSSVFSPNIQLSSTPTRVSWTFIAMESSSVTAENIAFGSGSGTPPPALLVFWGAQLVEGNVPGEYLPTSTNWNKVTSVTGPTTTTVGKASADHYDIYSTSIHVPPTSSVFLDIAPFTISTNNSNAATPAISIYGLY